jgi:signal transduction histidine kinase
LAIVLMIAEAYGGTASVANNDGPGADAWIAIPREATAMTRAGRSPSCS